MERVHEVLRLLHNRCRVGSSGCGLSEEGGVLVAALRGEAFFVSKLFPDASPSGFRTTVAQGQRETLSAEHAP
jgi:hypothetical protein